MLCRVCRSVLCCAVLCCFGSAAAQAFLAFIPGLIITVLFFFGAVKGENHEVLSMPACLTLFVLM